MVPNRKLLKRIVNKALRILKLKASYGPILEFHAINYLRVNARRMEHLASLRIPLGENMSVLDVGAGIGDLSSYYIDRGHRVTITDGRKASVRIASDFYPEATTLVLDMENPTSVPGAPFDIIHCYGLLYHLKNPQRAIEFMSENAKGIVFVETHVSHGDGMGLNLHPDDARYSSQALSGTGCSPTRQWVFEQLKAHFEYVYVPLTTPHHPRYPTDWTKPNEEAKFSHAIFIASKFPLENALLSTELIQQQRRHE